MPAEIRVPPDKFRCRRRHCFLVGISLPTVVMLLVGCGQPPPAVDPAPMKAAIEQYLKQNSMALRIKDIEHGPVVTGAQATMRVSLTHAELGGVSVEWDLEFAQEPSGEWRVVRHSVR